MGVSTRENVAKPVLPPAKTELPVAKVSKKMLVPERRIPEPVKLKGLIPLKANPDDEPRLVKTPASEKLSPLAAAKPDSMRVYRYSVFSELAGVTVILPTVNEVPDENARPLAAPEFTEAPERVWTPLGGPLRVTVETPELAAAPNPEENAKELWNRLPAPEALWVWVLKGPPTAKASLLENAVSEVMMTSARAGLIHNRATSPAAKNPAVRPR